MPKFAFFGTPYVARDTLALLVERGFSPALVVSSPDARRGRGMTLTPSETSAYAKEQKLPLLTPEKLDAAALEEIRSYGCDFAIVVAYGKIFPQSLIDAFPKGAVNVHYSLLPKYRGASPVEAALLAGDSVTGVAVQKMAKKLDAGDILAAREVAILPEETTRELRPRLIREGAELLADILPAFAEGTLPAIPQDEAHATHSGKISKEEGLLDLNDDARLNWNKYRAYAESPGTYFYMDRNGTQVRVKIKTARFENGRFIPDRVVPEGKKETNYADLIQAADRG
jgi:methionyl-tRNA formyltransferase